MEPERKIEKWLRAYAKKRRADAGDAFKLHPATRRLLQGEVARRVPKAGGASEPPSFWNWLRVRWALPLGFALLFCLGVAMFWPAAPSKQGLAFDKAAAPASAKELPAPAAPLPMAAVDNRPPLPAPVVASATLAAPKTPAAVTTELAFANAPAGLAENRTQAVTPFAETEADRLRRHETSAMTNAASPIAIGAGNLASESVTVAPPAAIAPPPVSMPALAGEPAAAATTADLASSFPAGASGVAVTERLAPTTSSRALQVAKMSPATSSAKFKSEAIMDSLQMNATKNSQRFVQAPLEKNLPVLTSFELQQNGNQISVVDRDGSVYNGVLQPVEAAVQTDLSKTRAVAVKPGSSDLLKKDFGVAGSAQQTVQNYFFKVSGANRSLKQNVVFTGNLTPISNETGNVAQNFGGGGGGGFGGQSKLADAKAAQQQQLFSNSRITGTVTIDNTNQMEINALPVNP